LYYMTYLVTLTSKNQLTLPAALAKTLKLIRGSRLTITLEQTGLRIQPISHTLRDLQGIVQHKAHQKNLTVDQAMKRAEERDARRRMMI